MKKLLVVVDMQKDFIDGALGTLEAQQIVPAVRKRICEYREAGDEVVFTLDTHGSDYMDTMEGKKLPVPHCLKGTEGWELDAGLREFDGKRFEKVTFGSPELAEYAAAAPFSVVVLGNFRRFLLVIFLFLFLHLDFSFIYNKFSMPFWDFFY